MVATPFSYYFKKQRYTASHWIKTKSVFWIKLSKTEFLNFKNIFEKLYLCWQKSGQGQGQIESRCVGKDNQNRTRQWKFNPKGFFTQSRREGVAIKQPSTTLSKVTFIPGSGIRWHWPTRKDLRNIAVL